MLSKAIILIVCVYFVRANDQSYCYMEDINPYEYFGTKTSYELVRSNLVIPESDVCKPVYIWALIRHGTRYSNSLDTKELSEQQRQILSNHEIYNRGSLCSKDLKNLKSWTSQEGKTTEDLAPQGKTELSNLGKRIAMNFHDLITNTSDNIYFQTTIKRRTKDSATAFAEGMFGSDNLTNINISLHEDVLHFLKNSESYQHKVAKNNETYKEMHLFLKTKYMLSLAKEVSERLGFNESLSEKTIKQMYLSCAYENAWSPHSYPGFCAAFTREHLQILEYCYFDLGDYYEVGYGTPYNVEMHTPILDDLSSKIEAASKSGNKSHKAHFYFSHSNTLSHTIMKLGLYHDEEPLLHNNYESRTKKREWFMHKISPFSDNLIAVLHKCNGQESDEYKVALYHNEYLLQIPGCPTLLCPLQQFLDVLRADNKPVMISSAPSLSTVPERTIFLFISVFLLLALSVINY